MDRDALVRKVRRRQALDALAFERDRAELLTEQLEETVASLEGARVDAAVYAQLGPDDVQLVRAALHDSDHDEAETDADADADADASPDDADDVQEDDADDAQEDEEEILRLQGELDVSGRLQAALERYLDVL